LSKRDPKQALAEKSAAAKTSQAPTRIPLGSGRKETQITMTTRNLFAAVLLGAASHIALVPVNAQSLEEREAWENQEKHMRDALEPVQRFCGITVEVTFDKPSWNKVRSEWGDASPSGRASDVTENLTNLCRTSETAKSAVVKGVKKLRVAYGGKNSGFRFTVKDGLIDYSVEADRPNIADELMSLLRKSL
jgi:hypothetical protein